MDEAADTTTEDGMVLIDNYWVDETEAEKFLADRAAAGKKAEAAMRTFCAKVDRQWAGSEDGEAVVGLASDGSIRSMIHLDPHAVALILRLGAAELVDYLHSSADD